LKFIIVNLFLVSLVAALTETQITKISVEHRPCYGGGCSAFTAFVWRGAKKNATWRGDANVKRLGEWNGMISTENFNKLAKLILDNGFFDLEDSYGDSSLDPKVTVAVTTSVDGVASTKSVTQHGKTGIPQNLQFIDDSITSTLDQHIKWSQPSSPTITIVVVVICLVGVITFGIIAGVMYMRRRNRYRHGHNYNYSKLQFQLNYD
jgi:hypothetical protein